MKVYATLIVISVFLMGCWQFVWSSDSNVYVYVLDVGQGDSIVVEIPGEQTILVDGGPGDYVLARLGAVLPPWIRKIDTVVLTHPHADHIEGLLDVMERYRVEEIMFNPVCYENSSYEYLVESLSTEGVRVVYLDQFGYSVEDVRGVRIGHFTEYWHECGARTAEYGYHSDNCGECALSLNNTSIVTSILYGENMVLLMGDAESEVETELAMNVFRTMGYPDTLILKAGHHCSRTASSEDFLDLTDPAVAICSLGSDNSFDHPHKETLDNFNERGIPYLRTDRAGTITVELAPNEWKIEVTATDKELTKPIHK